MSPASGAASNESGQVTHFNIFPTKHSTAHLSHFCQSSGGYGVHAIRVPISLTGREESLGVSSWKGRWEPLILLMELILKSFERKIASPKRGAK
jgi:hypothetical protein